MTKRLSGGIAALYHQPDDVRQVFSLSQAEAESLPRIYCVAVISITSLHLVASQQTWMSVALVTKMLNIGFLHGL